MAEYHARFYSAYTDVAAARHRIVAFAAHWFSGRDLADIESAAGEALANLAERGSDGEGQIDVHCFIRNDDLVVEVIDTAHGFERWNALDYFEPGEDGTRGFGRSIMSALMDEVQYREHGAHVRLVKHLSPPAVKLHQKDRRVSSV